MLDKNGQPCLLDPRYPTTMSGCSHIKERLVEKRLPLGECPFLSILCETPTLQPTIDALSI
jgi:hypothetical protein